MRPSLLQLRIEALAQHLMDVRDPSTWLDHLDLARPPDQNLWLTAVKAISYEADVLLGGLREAMSQLRAMEGAQPDPAVVGAAWQRYVTTLARSEEIFHDCMELLGGIALRDRLTDAFVWSFADELISECAEFVGQQTSFAIPAFEGTLSSTLRRVARVDFPDWHLWTLPLVAYQYGRIVLRETSLRRLVTELAAEDCAPQVQRLLDSLRDTLPSIDCENPRRIATAMLGQVEAGSADAADKLMPLADFLGALDESASAELARAAVGTIRETQAEARQRMGVLVGDVFATFSTGPAYACAAVVLRLNPASPQRAGRPSDAQRARVILRTLGDMGQGPGPGFDDVTTRLEEEWATLVAGIQGGDGDGPDDAATGMDVSLVLARIRDRVLKPEEAEYTARKWNSAKTGCAAWAQALANGEDPGRIDIRDGRRLRDVLNAAWWCRLEIMNDSPPEDIVPSVRRLTEAAIAASNDIINSRASRGKPTTFGG